MFTNNDIDLVNNDNGSNTAWGKRTHLTQVPCEWVRKSIPGHLTFDVDFLASISVFPPSQIRQDIVVHDGYHSAFQSKFVQFLTSMFDWFPKNCTQECRKIQLQLQLCIDQLVTSVTFCGIARSCANPEICIRTLVVFSLLLLCQGPWNPPVHQYRCLQNSDDFDHKVYLFSKSTGFIYPGSVFYRSAAKGIVNGRRSRLPSSCQSLG